MLKADFEELDSVQRTALWTLVSRAQFAKNGRLADLEATRIAATLDPSILARFGRPDPAFAARAELLDERLRAWLEGQGEGVVVSLGEGSETQRFRVPGHARWVSVDLPEVITLRDRLIPPDHAHTHRPGSVTRLDWLNEIRPGTCVVAQGLLMYLQESEVRRIFTSWEARVREVEAPGGQRGCFLFDVVPPWVRALSRIRIPVSRRFRLPGMPWATRPPALKRLLADTVGEQAELLLHPCPLPSGPLPVAGRTWVAEVRM